ncbi:UPF0481 protein At3g47200-like [Neltuma alba]|uniref:UPF0481 protein At3g47200-like n=1 Tax=Neltuma alba TaxID=207710 RepID=UPI0010A47258|nr:UPF0481 protein At3g47200-like [Prosopis alba]XP_028792156.1 UPF0481 protein At3g47200-like [Prosopis alba]
METGSGELKETNKELVSSIKERIEAISSLRSIFIVPEKLRTSGNDHGNEMYIPDTVSIGPFHHHRNGNLKVKEEHKLHYLYTLLSRKPNLEATLHQCIKALGDIEQTARHCYEGTLNHKSDEFVEIMLIDGCFIIELFLKYAYKGLRRRGDLIFTSELFFDVRKDLILLENQIPWMVLQSLFEIVPKPTPRTLSELALGFFKKMLPGELEFLREKFSQEGNHLLDLIHQCYIPTYAIVESKKAGEPKAEDMKCASDLRKHGIKFMRYTAASLLDISFYKGVFEIPPLETKKYNKILFKNLIALEQHHSDQIQYFTSYAKLMKAFISCKEDAKLFTHLRIVVSDSKDKAKHKDRDMVKEEALSLFSSLCDRVDVKKFYYAGVVGEANDYVTKGKSWWQKLKCGCLI